MGICRKNSKNKNMETHLLARGQWILLEEGRRETRNKYIFSVLEMIYMAPCQIKELCIKKERKKEFEDQIGRSQFRACHSFTQTPFSTPVPLFIKQGSLQLL